MSTFKPEKHHGKFGIWDLISRSWELVEGCKWPVWSIAILMAVASFVVQIIIALIFHVTEQTSSALYHYLIMPLVNNIVIAPFFGGAVMVGVRRARGEPVDGSSGYAYFNKSWPLILTMFFIAVLANIINYVVHLPAVVTALAVHTGWLDAFAGIISLLVYVFFVLSVPLVVDKNLSPLKAMKASLNIVKHCWFRVLVVLVILYLFLMIALIPSMVGSMIHPYARALGIVIFVAALIWLVPLIFLVVGKLYHRLVD